MHEVNAYKRGALSLGYIGPLVLYLCCNYLDMVNIGEYLAFGRIDLSVEGILLCLMPLVLSTSQTRVCIFVISSINLYSYYTCLYS